MSTQPAQLPRLTLTRLLHAPRALVWQAWTDSASVAQWWGPNGFTVPVCRIDLRVGGRQSFNKLEAVLAQLASA